jgi:hypothetical protein
MRRGLKLSRLVLSIAVGLVACEPGGVTHGGHGCTGSADQNFIDMNLILYHSDSRACTMNHAAGAAISSVATAVQDDAVYPGTIGTARQITVAAFEGYNFTNWTGSGVLGTGQVESFSWGADPSDAFAPPVWQAQGMVSYTAGPTPDFLQHSVMDWQLTLGLGVLRVDHTAGSGGGPGPPT